MLCSRQLGAPATHRLDAVTEAGAVLEAGIRERLVKAHVLRGALSQHVHLRAARRRRQLVPVVLRSASNKVSASHGWAC